MDIETSGFFYPHYFFNFIQDFFCINNINNNIFTRSYNTSIINNINNINNNINNNNNNIVQGVPVLTSHFYY